MLTAADKSRAGAPAAASVDSLSAAELKFQLSSSKKPVKGSRITSMQVCRKSKERARILLYAMLLVVDAVAISTGFLIGNVVRFLDPLAAPGLNTISLLVPLYAIVAFSGRSFSLEILQDVQLSVFRALRGFLLSVSALLILLFSVKASADLSRIAFSAGVPASAFMLCLMRFVFGYLAGRYYNWRFVTEVLIVDGVLVHPQRGQVVVFAQLSDLSPVANDPGNFGRIGLILANSDRVLVACRSEARVTWAQALKGVGVPVEILTPELDHMGGLGLRRIGGHSAVLIALGSLGFRDRTLKRTLDLGVAVSALAACAPFMCAVAAAIKLTSKGPVLFRQQRLGQGNRVFQVLKFRTMRIEDTDQHGQRSASQQDDRVTSVGRILRRCSIDELPQLINVIKGEMSIVGPRPHALGSTAGEFLFWQIDERYWQRAAVKPGITGLAQIRGFRGATQHEDDLTSRLQADLEYLACWSLWKDLVIIAKTAKVLVHPNAY